MVTIAGSKQQGGRCERLTFACLQSGVGRSRDSHASLAVSGPVLVGQKGQRGTHGTSGVNHTDWRWSGEQYQAFLHRPHHIAAVFPQRRQGLMSVTVSIVFQGRRGEKNRKAR